MKVIIRNVLIVLAVAVSLSVLFVIINGLSIGFTSTGTIFSIITNALLHAIWTPSPILHEIRNRNVLEA